VILNSEVENIFVNIVTESPYPSHIGEIRGFGYFLVCAGGSRIVPKRQCGKKSQSGLCD